MAEHRPSVCLSLVYRPASRLLQLLLKSTSRYGVRSGILSPSVMQLWASVNGCLEYYNSSGIDVNDLHGTGWWLAEAARQATDVILHLTHSLLAETSYGRPGQWTIIIACSTRSSVLSLVCGQCRNNIEKFTCRSLLNLAMNAIKTSRAVAKRPRHISYC